MIASADHCIESDATPPVLTLYYHSATRTCSHSCTAHTRTPPRTTRATAHPCLFRCPPQGKLAENEAKQAIIDRLASDMAALRTEEEEMERIRIELVEEEMEERHRRREAEEAERQLRSRIEMQRTQAEAMQDIAARRAAEAAEEAAFRQQMMEKFAHDDRVEQMNAQRRRIKVRGSDHLGCWGCGRAPRSNQVTDAVRQWDVLPLPVQG